MALTVPSDTPAAPPVAGDDPRADIGLTVDDLKMVRLYSRISAAISALLLISISIGILWLLGRLFGWRWDTWQTAVAAVVILAAAVLTYLRAELRLRSYRLDLTTDAVIFEYGRTRWHVPRAHIQLFDTESSIVLRLFRLQRCSLRTAGGTVIVSPVPVHVGTAIERFIYGRHDLPGAGGTDAGQ